MSPCLEVAYDVVIGGVAPLPAAWLRLLQPAASPVVARPIYSSGYRTVGSALDAATAAADAATGAYDTHTQCYLSRLNT